MGRMMGQKATCCGPFHAQDAEVRARDRAVLEVACGTRPGLLWRERMRKAMKRAGAEVYADYKSRLCVRFAGHDLHIGRLDLGLLDDARSMRAAGLIVVETPFETQLKALARALIANMDKPSMPTAPKVAAGAAFSPVNQALHPL